MKAKGDMTVGINMEGMTAEERAKLGAKQVLKFINACKTKEQLDEVERRLTATRKEIGYLLMYLDVRREIIKTEG